MPALPELSESNREALIIRWRNLLILGLIDFFCGTNDFGKLIVKEILDIIEGLIKAFAESLQIQLFENNGEWRGFKKIYEDILQKNLPDEFKNKLQELVSRISSDEFNSLRSLRNDETHYLNLPDIPKETVIRVWRILYELTSLIDQNLLNYAKQRPETRNFYNLCVFFKKVVIDGNREGIDLNKLKKGEVYYTKISNRKYKEIETEKGIFEIIRTVSEGKWS